MTRGQGQSLEPFEVPKVKSVKPSIKNLARNRGRDFLTPKLLLVSTILTKLAIAKSVQLRLTSMLGYR